MINISENIKHIRSLIPENVELVAVSKTKPNEDILEAYEEGQLDFGENKVQELVRKESELPKDIRWHMIGHLQRNKVKQIVGIVDLIHGVDSFKLLKEINKRAGNAGRQVSVLLQMHIATEDSKFGLSEDELKEILNSPEFREMEHVKLRGLMGMATFTNDQDQVRSEFKNLKGIFDRAQSVLQDEKFNILSMGMSGDYQIAIEEGGNMIRVGSSIFGARNYY